jgi:hypothetical protein
MTKSKISAQVRKVLRKFLYKKHWLCNVIFFIIPFLVKKKLNKKIKKKLKDEELEAISKQFDNFEFQDDEKENIERRLLAYISYANRVIQQYKNTKHKYMSLNLSFLAVISFFLSFFIDYYKSNLFQQLFIILGSFFVAFSIILNLLVNLRKNPTHALPQTTLWFYKDNVPDEIKKPISKETGTKFQERFHRSEKEFIREDLKQLFSLHLYQAHYANLAIKTRKRFRITVLVYFFIFFIPILIIPLFNYLISV